MRKRLLAATALCTSLLFLLQGPALAQSAMQNWSGPYLGMSFGDVVSKSHVDVPEHSGTFSENSYSTYFGLDGQNFAPGVVAGYNIQSGNLVVGVEGDASALALSATSMQEGGNGQSKLDALLTLRGRLGVVEGKALIYATAGVAAAHASFETDIGLSSSPTYAPARADGMIFGPTAGLGVEYALTDKLSIKAEGKIYSLSSLSAVGDTGKGSPNDPYTAQYHASGGIFSTGLNYHF